MKALIIDANSRIGHDMARVLAAMNIDLTLITRRGDRLRGLKKELAVSVDIVILDVSVKENCLALYQRFRDSSADVLVNNAGSGDFGEFTSADLDEGLNMTSTNIQAVHILGKLLPRGFVEKDRGYILNVASGATFLPGPSMTTCHATKAYVERLTLATHKELQKRNSHASISVFCSGPV